ncbi:hypothetical protein [Actinomycetospora callitridis]|uniref:hypothetical protein n=1 Tax=Actinomycetospora callitridis TaxID=913944 RepID=UPI002365ED36|nr:hypothetical protein [Actinomycetospora callitridis]MDD7921226.1 hypothetical protein [Actinomycetospora callitridis]
MERVMPPRSGPWASMPRWAPQAPAGLADLGELGEPWAASAWHHAVAMARGWSGEPTAMSGFGYPPPTAYRAVPVPVPAPRAAPVPVPAPRREPVRQTVPRWLPTRPIGTAPA